MIVSDCVEKSLNSLSQITNVNDPDVIFATTLSRGILKITGDAAGKFLQSIITNDITTDGAIYAMMLSPQGRYLFDFFIVNLDGAYILDTDLYSLDALVTKLKLYKLRSNVVIENISNDYSVVYSRKPLFLSKMCEYKDPRFEKMGLRTIVKAVGNLGHTDIYLQDKYQYAIPDGEIDLIRDKSMPLEYGMDLLHSIDYNKGCYVGQEVISRTKYQGVIRKQIFKIIAQEELSASQGLEIMASNKKIGTVCSCYKNQGIGLIRTEDYETSGDEDVTIGDISVRLELPEWNL